MEAELRDGGKAAGGRSVDAVAAGWRGVFRRVRRQVADDRLSVVAGGVAFYGVLASIPAVAALLSFYGLLFDAEQVQRHLSLFTSVLPPKVENAVLSQLQELTGASRRALGLGAAGGLLLTLWSSSSAMRALIKALNGAYDTEERRGFLRRLGLALVLTLGAVAGTLVGISTIVVLPVIQDLLGAGGSRFELAVHLRWPVIAFGFWLALVIVYRYGPNHDQVRWRGVALGALVATVMWLAGSALFSWYVSHFGNYSRAYGSMGAIIILLLWFLLTSWSVLIGAEINAEVDQQARQAEQGGGR